MTTTSDERPPARPLNFIEQIIEQDNAARRWGTWPDGRPIVHTRFPPEPNGYLHIGHAKSICLNYGLAVKYGGKFNLRFDDTNPTKEEREYIESIKRDVLWLGADYLGANGGGMFHASDYFDRMYAYAEELVLKGKAYVCELSAEEVSRRRGTPQIPATSPYRDRPVAENLRLLREMRDGRHPNGAMTLRAKIDLSSPNFNLRDPVMYRILHEEHPHTGSKWCIYPMYDWAHGLEDSIEGITHSICTLEFEEHRPLYDWFIDAVNEGRHDPGATYRARGDGATPPYIALLPDGREEESWGPRIHHPRQIEFAKFRPTYTVLSKRNLLKMVEEGVVSGWDDPRMPTIAGLRRRGYTPEAIRSLMEEVGVTKVESMIDIGRLENAVREHLNRVAPRAMAVLRPLKLVVENWPEGKVEYLDFVVNPEAKERGEASAVRSIPFSRVLYIEQDDFMENPPAKFFRLAPGREVRLRWGYFVRCSGFAKDASGNITEVRCTYDPATRGGDAPLGPDGQPTKKVRGTIHWVSADHAVPFTARLFDRLFLAEEPGARTGNYMDDLNPRSLEVVQGWGDPALKDARAGEHFQFERLGYFVVDPDSGPGALVFNRTVTLKDTWAKIASRA
jgi:glutaminyl-tRNA synthetase